MEGKQFKDAAAVHRAVGLLGYLATEDPVPEEYHLPLCKVLCGMELDEVFDFGPPLEEAEAEECSNLLTAVDRACRDPERHVDRRIPRDVPDPRRAF